MVGGNLADTAYRSCAAFTGSTAFFTLVSAVLLWRAEQGSQKAGQFRISGFSPLFGSAALPGEEGSWVLMTADTGSCHEQSNPGTFAPSIFFFKLKPLRTYSRR